MNALRTLLVIGIAALGCDGSKPSDLRGRAPAAGPAFLEPAPTRNTTSEAIARTNLDASIRSDRRQLARRADLPTAVALVDALMTRANFYGSFDDWDEALRVSKTMLDEHPDDPGAILLRARVLGTLHEFGEALDLIRAARANLPDEPVARAQLLDAQARHLDATARLALGNAEVDQIVAERRALASSVPTYQHVTGLALALAEQGRFEEADAAFRRSLERYRDVSPFPFAWVAFQRGVMWSEQAGRPDLARPLYEKALSHLPGYVLANVHLAELDALDGDVRAAVERLIPLIGSTQDPEPLAVLATVEPSAEAARSYAARADAAYRRLLERFPSAFAHHVGQAP